MGLMNSWSVSGFWVFCTMAYHGHFPRLRLKVTSAKRAQSPYLCLLYRWPFRVQLKVRWRAWCLKRLRILRGNQLDFFWVQLGLLILRCFELFRDSLEIVCCILDILEMGQHYLQNCRPARWFKTRTWPRKVGPLVPQFGGFEPQPWPPQVWM